VTGLDINSSARKHMDFGGEGIYERIYPVGRKGRSTLTYSAVAGRPIFKDNSWVSCTDPQKAKLQAFLFVTCLKTPSSSDIFHMLPLPFQITGTGHKRRNLVQADRKPKNIESSRLI
jgi:hypothetical protein